MAKITVLELDSFFRSFCFNYTHLPRVEKAVRDRNWIIGKAFCPLLRVLVFDSQGKMKSYLYFDDSIQTRRDFQSQNLKDYKPSNFFPFETVKIREQRISIKHDEQVYTSVDTSDTQNNQRAEMITQTEEFLLSLPMIKGKLPVHAVPKRFEPLSLLQKLRVRSNSVSKAEALKTEALNIVSSTHSRYHSFFYFISFKIK